MTTRYDTSTPEGRSQRARHSGKAAQKPEVWAKNISRAWPSLDDKRRQEVIDALAPIAQQERGSTP